MWIEKISISITSCYNSINYVRFIRRGQHYAASRSQGGFALKSLPGKLREIKNGKSTKANRDADGGIFICRTPQGRDGGHAACERRARQGNCVSDMDYVGCRKAAQE